MIQLYEAIDELEKQIDDMEIQGASLVIHTGHAVSVISHGFNKLEAIGALIYGIYSLVKPPEKIVIPGQRKSRRRG